MAETHVSAADLKVVDLKKELEKRGCSKSGNKAQLIERLKQSLQQEGHTLDSYFGEKVAAQKHSSEVSGQDMARWCNLMAKKPNEETTPTQEPTKETPPPSSTTPTPVKEQHPPPEEREEANHVTPESQPNQNGNKAQVPVEKEEVKPSTIEPKPTTVEKKVEESKPVAIAQPVVEKKVEEETVAKLDIAEPIVDDILDSKGSPLSFHADGDGELPITSETKPETTEKANTFSPVKEKFNKKDIVVDGVDQKSREEVQSTFVFEPAMLEPRHQLQSTLRRLSSGGRSGTRKRQWVDEVRNQPNQKIFVVSWETIKAMDLPNVSDVEEDVLAGQLDGPGRRRKIVPVGGGGDSGDYSQESAGEGPDAMDTVCFHFWFSNVFIVLILFFYFTKQLELTVEERGDDLCDNADADNENKSKRKTSLGSNAPLVTLEVDEPKRAKRQVSPSRHEPTNILHIEYFDEFQTFIAVVIFFSF